MSQIHPRNRIGPVLSALLFLVCPTGLYGGQSTAEGNQMTRIALKMGRRTWGETRRDIRQGLVVCLVVLFVLPKSSVSLTGFLGRLRQAEG